MKSESWNVLSTHCLKGHWQCNYITADNADIKYNRMELQLIICVCHSTVFQEIHTIGFVYCLVI